MSKDLKKHERQFKQFCDTFKRYQKLFGLTGYRVHFKYEPIDGYFARISITQIDMKALVKLNSDLHKEDKPFQDIKKNAKHEALHLLLAGFACRANRRYTTEEELDTAEEELVNKLEALID